MNGGGEDVVTIVAVTYLDVAQNATDEVAEMRTSLNRLMTNTSGPTASKWRLLMAIDESDHHAICNKNFIRICIVPNIQETHGLGAEKRHTVNSYLWTVSPHQLHIAGVHRRQLEAEVGNISSDNIMAIVLKWSEEWNEVAVPTHVVLRSSRQTWEIPRWWEIRRLDDDERWTGKIT